MSSKLQTETTFFRFHKRSFIESVLLTIILATVLRGLVPVLSNGLLTTLSVYRFSSLAACGVAIWGLFRSFKSLKLFSPWLHNLLLINLCLFMVWTLVEWWITGDLADASFNLLTCAIIPYTIYIFANLSERNLYEAAGVITIVLSVSILIDFTLLNTAIIPSGKVLFEHIHSLIRQNGVPWLSRTGPVLRAPGLTGNSHDSANVLIMLSVLWFAKCFVSNQKKIQSAAYFIVALVALFATASAANIVAAIACFGAVLGFLFYTSKGRGVLLTCIAIGAIFAVVLIGLQFTAYNFSSGILNQWMVRVGPDGDWRAMMAIQTAYRSMGEIFYWLASGHSTAAGVEFGSEVALLKIFFSYGFLPASTLVLILIYPLWLFKSVDPDTRKAALPLVGAVVVGFLSLWHYGSLFRSTSLYLFFFIYAIAVRKLQGLTP